jgi:putative transposase
MLCLSGAYLDVYSNKAIGYALSFNMDTQLTLSALKMVIDRRYPPPGCIQNFDRGVQCVKRLYQRA